MGSPGHAVAVLSREAVQNKERSSPLAFGPSHLLLLFGAGYSLWRLARIPRVDYKRKPT